MFKAGDVVVLNSGGPYMVINEINDVSGILSCAWFDDNNMVHSAPFKPVMVKGPFPTPSVDALTSGKE